MTEKLAEVIAAASTTFTAQCYRLYEAPPLGALVRVGEQPAIYAVVCNVASGPLDPGRRVLPRGEGEESEEGVYRSNPQLSQLLATTFEALIVGYQHADGRLQGLPPLPPRVHAFVSSCSHAEIVQFTRDLGFLKLLLRAPGPAGDELLIACLRHAAAARSAQDGARQSTATAFLLDAGRAIARGLAGDSARLSTLLKGLAP
ncbi:MAG: hypothetical protein EXR48_03865 [Dehalococcoidia bacterium]|nr:hypothetical protein [Dehalococcoidia bacterium]